MKELNISLHISRMKLLNENPLWPLEIRAALDTYAREVVKPPIRLSWGDKPEDARIVFGTHPPDGDAPWALVGMNASLIDSLPPEPYLQFGPDLTERAPLHPDIGFLIGDLCNWLKSIVSGEQAMALHRSIAFAEELQRRLDEALSDKAALEGTVRHALQGWQDANRANAQARDTIAGLERANDLLGVQLQEAKASLASNAEILMGNSRRGLGAIAQVVLALTAVVLGAYIQDELASDDTQAIIDANESTREELEGVDRAVSDVVDAAVSCGLAALDRANNGIVQSAD